MDDSGDGSSSTVGWILIPVIVIALASIITTVVLVMKGLCCKCCYANFKGLQQYQKSSQGSPEKVNGSKQAS